MFKKLLRNIFNPAPTSTFRLSPLWSRSELPHRTTFQAYLLVLGLSTIWVAGPFLAPVGMAHGWISANPSNALPDNHRLPDLLAFILRSAYGRVCHQIPERSLWIQGHPMAVCARCLGIYLGYFAGLVIYPLMRKSLEIELPRRRWLLLALLPLAIDFTGGYLGLFENTIVSRIATGFVAGSAGAVYTATGLIAATRAAIMAVSTRRYSWPLRERRGAHNA